MKCALSFHKFILLLLNLTLICHAIAASESPQAFSFQGRLFDAAGTTPLTELISIKLQIFNPSANCLLYQETQNVNTTSTNGVFSISVGSATGAAKRTAGTDPGLTMAAIFKNDTTTATRAAGANCAAGYTPTVGDVRLLRVTITPTSTGTPETLSPDQTINSVPQAIVAETLQGLLPSSFVQKDAIYVTAANIDKIFGNLVDGVVDASDLHTHDDRYVQLSSASTQDFGTGGYNTTGASSVGSATNFANTILSVQTTADTKIGLAVRANAVTQSADLFQVQDSSGTSLMSVSSAGAVSSAASTITSTSGNQLTVKYDTTNKMTMNVSSSGTTSFTAAGTSPLIALLGGDVGIGTSSPDRPLHVTSASAPTILQENTAAGADQKIRYSTTTTSGDMAWGKFTDNMSSSTEHMRLMSSGNLGVGVTSATAVLHLKAGTATASTAPLKFTSGTLLSTPENGAVEYDGTDYYASSGGARKKLALLTSSGDFTSVTNSSGAITLSAGGTNQNVTLSPSGTGVVTTSSPTTITNATASTSSSTGALVVSGGVGVGGDIFTAGNVSSGGVFLSPLGSAAAPTYAFTGDTDTGVFSPAADIWAISTGGSEKLRVSSGKLSIGMANPTGKIGIYNGSVDSVKLLSFQESSSTDTFYLEGNYAGTGATGNWLTMRDWNNNNIMTWRGDGFVGVGTTSPGAPLHVSKTDTTTSGTIYGGVEITPTYNQASATTANTDLYINRTETSVGSGAQYLIDARAGGVSKFSVSNTGVMILANTLSGQYIASGQAYNGNGNTMNSTVSIQNRDISSATYGVQMSSGTISNTSGSFAATKIIPIYNETASTASNTDLLINRTETSIGSGTQRLIDAQVGGTTKFNVDNSGNGYFAGTLGIGVASPSTTLHVAKTDSTTYATSSGVVGVPNGTSQVLENIDTTNSTASLIQFVTRSGGAVNRSYMGLISSATQSGEFVFGQRTGASAYSERLRINSSGYVGIGTTNPTRALSVVGMTSVTSSTQYGGSFWSNGTNTIADIKGTSATNDGGMLDLYNGGTKNVQLVATGNSYLNGGNLGIGTTSPAYVLDVAGNGGNITAVFGADNSATTRTDATQKTTRLGVPHYTNAEEPMALFYATSAVATNSITIGGGTTLLNAATQISLYTAANNTTTTGTERLRIDSSGNVGIGTTSPGYKLQVGAAADGSEARANAWNILSDERLKKNFQAIPNALDKIISLNGYFYQWNKGPDQKRKLGLKAQEVEKVFPEIVSQGKDGYKSVSYDHLIAPVINAIKELFTLVKGNDQKVSREIIGLKIKNSQLEAENKAIKEYLCHQDRLAPFCRQ
ncbi:MAG: tail fiber domain-containing protein [Bacteriovoracia bacterium]